MRQSEHAMIGKRLRELQIVEQHSVIHVLATSAAQGSRMAPRMKFAFAARVLAALLIIGAMTLAWTQSQGAARAEANPRPVHHVASEAIRVLDAETIQDVSGVVYRLENIDAAAAGARAQCAGERDMGDNAAAEARALVGRARP